MSDNPKPRAGSGQERLVFVANSMYSDVLSGGDIHTLNMAAAAVDHGYAVHFLCGHALAGELRRRQLPVGLTLTDPGIMPLCDFNTLGGQLKMLKDYLRRLRGTSAQLAQIQPEDIAYANTDFWWDSVPVIRSRARRRLMILGMDCPTLPEILARSRPDVKSIRLPSVHYWLSQHSALRRFRGLPNKRLLYVHPNQKARLLHVGYEEDELALVSNGFDLEAAAEAPEQPKVFDVAWTGRVHQQKGIDDLLQTLAFLAGEFADFRAVLIGNLKPQLGPRIEALGLSGRVEFPGFVSEREKFKLLKSSRLYLMPSRYESWGIVVAEALASALPVVAYDLAAYRPVFGNLLRYVPPFDRGAFQRAAADEIRRLRAGAEPLDRAGLEQFVRENSWKAAGERFIAAVRSQRR